MRKGILFLNPRAGTFPADEAAEFHAAAEAAGLEIVEITPETDVAAIAAAAIAEGRKSIVVGGGDGSLHHVVQALAGTEGILGVIPLGTLNHLAHDMGVPLEWRAALDNATNGEVHQIDVGRINGQYFLNTVMIGLYPTISQYRERFRSTHSKWRAYAKGAHAAMRRFPGVKLAVEIDGRPQSIKAPMFAILVNSYDLKQGGLLLPRTSFTDGRLTVLTIGDIDRLQFAIAAAKYLRGRISEVAGFKSVRAKAVRVDTAHHRVRLALDGELIYMTPPLQAEIVPSSLLVRMPAPATAP